ncbi:MAG: hypothetical protein ACYCQJ_14665 [Nitrososphaerales archaeon]
MVFWDQLDQIVELPPGINITTDYHEAIPTFIEEYFIKRGGIDLLLDRDLLMWFYSQPHYSLTAWRDDTIVGYIFSLMLGDHGLVVYLAVKEEKTPLTIYLIQTMMGLIKKGYYFGVKPRGNQLRSCGVMELPKTKLTLTFPQPIPEGFWEQLLSCPNIIPVTGPEGRMMLLKRHNAEGPLYLLVTGEGTVKFENPYRLRCLNWSGKGLYLGLYRSSLSSYPLLG